ncbi:MAG TPA: DUF4349 domain-containing protein [Gaiellaceae bacterium]
MSQRDLVAELRAARIEAPAEVRARVRLTAAADTTPTPRRTFTWRRALVVAVPVAAAVAATIVFTRPSHQPAAVQPVERGIVHAAVPDTLQKSAGSTPAFAPAPTTTRVQRYGAYLALRVPTPNGVSTGVKEALRITKSLGGYAGSVHVSTGAKSGSADLTLKIPRTHVQEAIARLSAIGTITAEQVGVQDRQTAVNATNRTIARLQRELATLRAQTQTPITTARIAALVRQIQSLQRAQATTVRTARYATVNLHLGTAAPKPAAAHHGPLHGLGVAFRWLGIGAIYVLALGAPLLFVLWLAWIASRTIRRRREDALLSRS